MLRSLQFGRPSSLFRGREWACLLLAITFLYNPFLAASAAPLGRSVSHLPSFRATVASSELLKFKPQEVIDAVTIAEVELSSLVSLPAPQRSPLVLRDSSEPVPTQCFIAGSLWFRPPPLLADY
jgi:hypothetical protein